jgi:hypothetical protein
MLNIQLSMPIYLELAVLIVVEYRARVHLWMIPAGKGYGFLARMPNIVSTLLRASFKYLLHPIAQRPRNLLVVVPKVIVPFGFDHVDSSKASITASGFFCLQS